MRKNEADSVERKLTKILNRTDLAKSGSHGGLVVTKNIQKPLAHFFELPSRNLQFRDERDGELFPVHYEDYTSNGTFMMRRLSSGNCGVTGVRKYGMPELGL